MTSATLRATRAAKAKELEVDAVRITGRCSLTVLLCVALWACVSSNKLVQSRRFEYCENAATGPGFLVGHGGETWRRWDTYFHGHTTFTDWKSAGGVVTAIGVESNDFYRLLDWEPAPFRNTWWFSPDGRIDEILLEPLGTPKSRLDEFRQVGVTADAAELAYLMPNGEIDPTSDRPERFKAILLRWREAAKLSKVSVRLPVAELEHFTTRRALEIASS